MAQISSYPSLTPQLGDKVLGSNSVDASGTAVVGNPTAQFTLTSVKTLVDQEFVQQLSSSNVTDQAFPAVATKIVFGALDTSNVNVTIDATGVVTFVTAGTYYVQQKYLYGVLSQVTRYFLFRSIHTAGGAASQYGPASLDVQTAALTNTGRVPMYIDYMITAAAGDQLEFEFILDANGNTAANLAYLYNRTINQWGPSIPSAQVIISKLI